MTDRSRLDSTLNRPNLRFTLRSLAKFLAICLHFSTLVVALSENALGRAFGRHAQQPVQAPRDAGNKSDDETEARLLEPGKAIKRELAGGASHTYRIRLNAGQFLKVIIEQQGIDIVARLIGPDDKQIMEFDSERRLRGQETVESMAEAEGDYRLVVQPRQRAAPAGAYEIRIDELRAATENDRDLHEARKLYVKAFDLLNAGKYGEAQPYFEGALEIREKRLGPGHSDVGQVIHGLATIHHYQGDYAKAGPLFQRALAIREKSLGLDHLTVAASLNNLATIYSKLGDYAKAEPLHKRALAIREKSLGPDHTEVARSLNELANLYFKMGDYAKAEPLYQRALAIREKSLGPDHPAVANSLNNLAGLYFKMGDYAKAEPPNQRALAILEKTLGPEHPDIVRVLVTLAMLYTVKGDFDRALTVQARANSIGERNLASNLATGSERQKLAYLALFSKQNDFTLTLHSQALPYDPQALDLAFTTLLRRKGRGLDVMANTIGALRRRATPEDQALFDQLADSRSQLAALTLKELGTDKPETYRARLKPLEDRVEELESALSARRPELRAQPVTLTAVQSALPAGSALVEFVVYTPQDLRNEENNKLPPRYLAYLLAAQGQPRWVDLGEAAPIDRAIASWRQALRDPRRADVKRLARAVDEKVMLPVRALAQSGFD